MKLLLLGLAAIAAASKPLPTAVIDSGAIVGTTTTLPSSTAVVNKYLGVPFGKRPVRFSPPEPAERWSTTYNATKWGPACFQEVSQAVQLLFNLLDMPPQLGGEDEDCLNLNVFTPANASAGSKAVLFWLYGGSYRNGGAAVPQYDGSSFAANQDVVVVTINYRTNAFGFPADKNIPLKERNLGYEKPDSSYQRNRADQKFDNSLLDQRLALDWVNRNIAALGGDPSKVTIMGESAGATSVDALVVTPPEPVPFRAAIMESGQTSIKTPVDTTRKQYNQSWQKLLDRTNCTSGDTIKCLREVPARELKRIATNETLVFGPIPDDYTMAKHPRQRRLNSTHDESSIARVPVLIGSNGDEAITTIIGQNDTRKFLQPYFGNLTDALLAKYPLGSPGGSYRARKIISYCDGISNTMLYANESAIAGIPTWRYLFNASFPNNEKGYGAYHTSEIPFVFGTYPQQNKTHFEEEVSKSMQKAWADFAKDPYKGPGWAPEPAIGIFGDGVKAGMSVEGKKPLKSVNSKKIDFRCPLYSPVYT
ncbi:Alpha/Beta hydrolase protein [Penicillium citrinum]|uniref:Alpha/Beta hydrolase protein n=1 Tax=Penicillium citrinum TaxID=5077 RepID=A0A9W9NDF9_PENCI|nr:Alpha/Beta hydrolase protein [Penicillium citrinum]KAJ5217845.1 Alpha/Beta hydrolase protein [Penicillium citrinum]